MKGVSKTKRLKLAGSPNTNFGLFEDFKVQRKSEMTNKTNLLTLLDFKKCQI